MIAVANPMTPACRQCGSTSVIGLGPIPDAELFAGQALRPPWPGGCLYECTRCHLGFRHPIRSEQAYERLYEAAGETIWVSGMLRVDQLRVKELIESRPGVRSVLDVGCYDGSLLQALGPQIDKYGIEASTAAADVARSRGVQIVASKLSDLSQVQQRFDVICAVDVIEHTVNPAAFVRSLLPLLAPEGVLIVSSGSLDTPQWRWVGGCYWYCSFPEHISFVSPQWGRSLAAETGLELQQVQRFSYSGISEKLASRRRHFFFRVFRSKLRRNCTALFGWPGPARVRSLGQPGLFADHIILSYRRPVAVPPTGPVTGDIGRHAAAA